MATEEYKISGSELLDRIKHLLKEGNARRISIRNEKGESVVEFPLTIGAIGAVLAPVLAAVGAVAALLSKCTLVVERRE